MLTTATAFAAGLFAWTWLEYVIHYWLGHLPKGRTFTSAEHLHHHADILYFTPLRIKARAAAPLLIAALAGAGWAFGWGAGAGFAAGIAAGWTAYEWLHRFIHVHGPHGAYSRWACRTHLHHHFQDPRTNHGVTTPLWDHVFRTWAPVGPVRVPRGNLAKVPWLAQAWADAAEGAPGVEGYVLR